MRLAAELALLIVWLRLLLTCALGILARHRSPKPRSGAQGRISVVVPALDEEDVIEATLTSLYEQALLPWEVVVVDDGSRDRTREISERLLRDFGRGQVIHLPNNRGKAEALNIGILATSGDFVATVDADTRLEPGSMEAALAALMDRGAQAAAFYIEVENRTSVMGRLQRQEYVAAMNFERAGQDSVGAISILPGAATLYRREVLISHRFSARTRTEDADLTLELSRLGIRIVQAMDAIASTAVPVNLTELFAQRVRWTAGHLQCCIQHASRLPASRRFWVATFPNFVASTLFGAVGLVALITVWVGGRTLLLGLDWIDVSEISIILTYTQRGCASLLDAKRAGAAWIFLLEPAATGLLGLAALLGALHLLMKEKLLTDRNIC